MSREGSSVQFFYPDTPDLPLTPGHRFPAGKYRMLRDQVVAEGILGSARLIASTPATRADLERAHSPAYVDAALTGTLSADIQRGIGLPWSEILIARSRATVGGSIQAARSALETGFSGQLAGGTHHAHRDFGSGFCVFNDLAVSSLALLAEGRVNRIAILDLDVHQGDGNAAILGPNPHVFVVSVHGERNFPFTKPPSDLDVGLADGTGDDAYLAALEPALEQIAGFRPDLLLYLSGADALKSDRLGRLDLSITGLATRDRRVFEFCHRRALPVSLAIGGGYADPITDSVEAYANTFRVGVEVFGG
jgi:acetoin utilization deacetylase AcuC-like enzyme